MSAWRWKGSVVLVCVAASCGGVSTSRKDDDGSSKATGGVAGTSFEQGGSAGTQRGGAPAIGGTTSGGRGPRGGSTGTTGGSSGNAGFGGDRGGSGGDAGESGAGMCSDGGAPSRSFRCELSDFETACSPEASCAGLGCGKPWSYFDGELCRRELCFNSSYCSGAERCVATPVAGKFEFPHGEFDLCNPDASDCSCVCGYFPDGNFWPGACLTDEELPPTECPIENLDCSALIAAGEVTDAFLALYEDHPDPTELGAGGATGDTFEGLQACRQKIEEREFSVCPF